MVLFSDVRSKRISSLITFFFALIFIVNTVPVRALDIERLSVAPPNEADLYRSRLNFHGYLFVNGEYIASPYEVTFENSKVIVNGIEIDPKKFELVFDETQFEFASDGRASDGIARGEGIGRRPGFRRGGRGPRDGSQMPGARGPGARGPGARGPGARGPGAWGESAWHPGAFRGPRGPRGDFRGSRSEADFFDTVSLVEIGAVVVLFDGERPFHRFRTDGGLELIRSLVSAVEDARSPDTTLASTASLSSSGGWERPSRGDTELGRRLIAEFQPSAEFLAKAHADLERTDAAESEGNLVVASSFWVDQLGYPLTVLAMAIVVLGFGHLLQHRPQLEPTVSEGGSTDWSSTKKVVVRSLTIVGLLSAIDLIWTSVSARAGVMREMNPIGSGLIDDPVQLSLFKVLVTGTSIGILYVLHRRPVAQVASWWCCLVLTLLTARWLVFNSMFL